MFRNVVSSLTFIYSSIKINSISENIKKHGGEQTAEIYLFFLFYKPDIKTTSASVGASK